MCVSRSGDAGNRTPVQTEEALALQCNNIVNVLKKESRLTSSPHTLFICTFSTVGVDRHNGFGLFYTNFK